MSRGATLATVDLSLCYWSLNSSALIGKIHVAALMLAEGTSQGVSTTRLRLDDGAAKARQQADNSHTSLTRDEIVMHRQIGTSSRVHYGDCTYRSCSPPDSLRRATCATLGRN